MSERCGNITVNLLGKQVTCEEQLGHDGMHRRGNGYWDPVMVDEVEVLRLQSELGECQDLYNRATARLAEVEAENVELTRQLAEQGGEVSVSTDGGRTWSEPESVVFPAYGQTYTYQRDTPRVFTVRVPMSPNPAPKPPAAPGPDRAIELLRELCELDGDRIDGAWLAAFVDIRARARALVEGTP